MKVGTTAGDVFICPLCKYDSFTTKNPDRFWWHLAIIHKTTELNLERYAVSYAIKRGWLKEEITVSTEERK